jgi:hypothetical protein
MPRPTKTTLDIIKEEIDKTKSCKLLWVDKLPLKKSAEAKKIKQDFLAKRFGRASATSVASAIVKVFKPEANRDTVRRWLTSEDI